MTAPPASTAIVVTTYHGQRSSEETARLAAEGVVPRNSAVELARLVNADIIDSEYMQRRATRVARAVASIAGLPAGQAVEALLRRRTYRRVLAWADRIGLPLALMNKLTAGRQDVLMVSVDLSSGKKGLFLERLRVHSHLRAIVNSSTVQVELAAEQLGVPREVLHLVPPGVDTHFWRPQQPPSGRRFCAVGWEARDYATFIAAVAEVDADVEVALGSLVLATPTTTAPPGTDAPAGPPTALRLDAFDALKGTAGYESYRRWREALGAENLPLHVEWHQQLKPPELRSLYARSRFVVIPLHDVPFDAGYTAILEAMAMGKAVIVTRTQGQVDLVADGVQGLYVEAGDPVDMRRAIRRLLDSPEEAERMGLAGRKLVEERYTLDDYVQRLASLLQG